VTIPTDELSYLDQIELENVYNSIDNRIRNERKNHKPTANLEVDLCYVFRELEIRKHRTDFASKYFGHAPFQS